MKVERSVSAGTAARQRAIRSSVFSCAAGRFIARSTSVAGRDARSPRSFGMMQKLQRLLQPSEIFKYA